MVRIILALYIVLLSVPFAAATTVERPAVKSGDSWIYQSTTEQTANQIMATPDQWIEKHYEVTAIRAGLTGILVSRKERGSKQSPIEILVGSDWSKYRSINGEETIFSQPLKFPLEPGKSWELKFTENNPIREYKFTETQIKYAVVGWEEITVLAGKFKAIKIEADGKWKSERAPSINTSTNSRMDQSGTTVVMQANNAKPSSATGRTYSVYWYVPETKMYVKSVEEFFSSNGRLSRRITEELESFKMEQ